MQDKRQLVSKVVQTKKREEEEQTAPTSELSAIEVNLLRIVERHHDRPATLQNVARKAGLSPSIAGHHLDELAKKHKMLEKEARAKHRDRYTLTARGRSFVASHTSI